VVVPPATSIWTDISGRVCIVAIRTTPKVLSHRANSIMHTGWLVLKSRRTTFVGVVALPNTLVWL
jgi:hypothetical protein